MRLSSLGKIVLYDPEDGTTVDLEGNLIDPDCIVAQSYLSPKGREEGFGLDRSRWSDGNWTDLHED